jgi:transcriptional regulator with XRE-family HTH domain
MNLNSRKDLIARLRRGRKAREQFVESHLSKSIAHQIRATRDRLPWSQAQLAREAGMTQNAISRLESPGYGKPTITTLKRLAAAMDVGLVVHFVPFSQLIDWVSGTPRVDRGLTTESLAVPCFDAEEAAGLFRRTLTEPTGDIPDLPPLIGDASPVAPEATVDRLVHLPRKPPSMARPEFVMIGGTHVPVPA